MRYLIFIPCILFSVNSFSAPQMKSIEQILNAEDTPATRLVVMQRCSAVYLTASSYSNTREDTKYIGKELKDVADFFSLLAIQFSKKESNLMDLTVDGNVNAVIKNALGIYGRCRKCASYNRELYRWNYAS
jgi:hypothetical protein